MYMTEEKTGELSFCNLCRKVGVKNPENFRGAVIVGLLPVETEIWGAWGCLCPERLADMQQRSV